MISLYKHVLGLESRDLAQTLRMDLKNTEYLMAHGKLNRRNSPQQMLQLANRFHIDPEQILFRALPELAPAFDRVASTPEGLHLALLDVALPPRALLAMIRRPGDDKVHCFTDILRAYRLWNGIPSAKSISVKYRNLEAGNEISYSENLMEFAAKLNMPPLLLILGTWPELLSLFDVVDSQGRVLHRSVRERSRLVIVVNHISIQGGRKAPENPGLPGYMHHLLANRGLLYPPDLLEQHGLSINQLGKILGGSPPNICNLHSLAELFELNPFEETRMIAESVLAWRKPPNPEALRALITLARSCDEAQDHTAKVSRDGCRELSSGHSQEVKVLNDTFLAAFKEYKTSNPSRGLGKKHIKTYVAQMLALLNAQS